MTTSSHRRRNPAAVPSPESSQGELGVQAGRGHSGGPILPSSSCGNQPLTSQVWTGQYSGERRNIIPVSGSRGRILLPRGTMLGNNHGMMTASLAGSHSDASITQAGCGTWLHTSLRAPWSGWRGDMCATDKPSCSLWPCPLQPSQLMALLSSGWKGLIQPMHSQRCQ